MRMLGSDRNTKTDPADSTATAEVFMSSLLRLRLAVSIALGALPSAFALADETVLVLSAYPAEQAQLLARLEPQPPEVFATFNGRRFFAGTIAGKSVVMGLTGIGMLNAHRTTEAALAHFTAEGIPLRAIVFSGVAGTQTEDPDIHIGHVTIPRTWSGVAPDGTAIDPIAVDSNMLTIASGLVASGEVTLAQCVPVPDTACLGPNDLPPTPLCMATPSQVHVVEDGYSSDPYGNRAPPCLSHAGDLLGCEACGAPPNTEPGIAKFVEEGSEFLDPQFFQDLFEYFGGANEYTPDVVDMETAAVARLAKNTSIPFIAFRGSSDGSGDPLSLPGFPFQFFVYQQLAADNTAATVIEFLDRLP